MLLSKRVLPGLVMDVRFRSITFCNSRIIDRLAEPPDQEQVVRLFTACYGWYLERGDISLAKNLNAFILLAGMSITIIKKYPYS